MACQRHFVIHDTAVTSLRGGSCTYGELCEKSICLKCPCAAHEANYSRSNSLDLSQTLVFQFVRITSNAPDTDCHQGVKRRSLLWEAGGGRGFGKGLPLDESCLSLTRMPNAESSARHPPAPPLNIPSFFYNPLLLSLSLCVVVKEPQSNPPFPTPLQWRELWSVGGARLSSLSLIFPLLILPAEEWGVIRTMSSQAFSPPLNPPPLPNLFVFPSVYLCTLSQEKPFFKKKILLFNHLCVKRIKETELVLLIKWRCPIWFSSHTHGRLGCRCF